MTHDSYDRDFAYDQGGTADEFGLANVGWSAPSGSRTPLAGKFEPPQTCTDGSLVIDAAGQVEKATPEQQRIALKARVARTEDQSRKFLG
jgi:hypothetical protein